MTVLPTQHCNTPPRARLRFGQTGKSAQFRVSLQSLFAFTTLTATVLFTLQRLFHGHWPWLPVLALVPPLIASFLLLCATGHEIWKGVFVGALLGAGLVLLQNDCDIIFNWGNGLGSRNNALRLTLELMFIWVFFPIAACPLVGGCLEAIRKRYVTLGIYTLLATFLSYFSLVNCYLWIVATEYWK